MPRPTLFANKWVYLKLPDSEQPLECKILTTVTECNDDMMYLVELCDKTKMYIAISDVGWIQIKKTDKKLTSSSCSSKIKAIKDLPNQT